MKLEDMRSLEFREEIRVGASPIVPTSRIAARSEDVTVFSLRSRFFFPK